MKIIIFIISIVIIYIAIYFYFAYNYPDMTYVLSDIDNNYYLVRNTKDKNQSANMLGKIRQDIIKLSDFLYKNREEKNLSEYGEYIELLYSKAKDIIFVESTQNSIYTSYSVNKGEQIVFCLRTKDFEQKLHDYNLVMYVVLHEISHVACPIYDNHGPLFRKIFAFIANQAIKLNLYEKIDFNKNPEIYCGMQITDSIV
jgi:predicted metal-dependent hydrolase